MFIYTFSGKVLPERAYVTIGPIPRYAIKTVHSDSTLSYEADIVISIAQVLVVARSSEAVENFRILRYSVESVVRGVVDAYGYLEGRGYDVEITSVIDSTGERWEIFPVEENAIQATKSDRSTTLDELLNLLANPSQATAKGTPFKMVQLRSALGDLREAIRLPDYAAFFCYRAIECLRQCYLDPNSLEDQAERRDSWSRMANELCIDRSWFIQIQEASTVNRHGRYIGLTERQRVDLMLRTWKVVDRFIMSAKNSFQPLSEEVLSIPDFPVQQ